jgi:dynein heavy chain
MKDATKLTPILIILSSGADATRNIQSLLSDYEKDTSQFKMISLGQGQGDKAKEAIKLAQLNGDWVCL